MPVTATVDIVNTASVDTTLANQLKAITEQAMAQWSAVLAGNASLRIRVEIVETPAGRADGAPGSLQPGIAVGGINVAEPITIAELRTETNLNGSDYDMVLRVSPNYLINELFLDPTPGTSNDIPNDRTDALSVMLHEIGHALGFYSYLPSDTTPTWPHNFRTNYDYRTTLSGGDANFSGPNTLAVLGGAGLVPLTDGNWAHYGNTIAAPGTHLLNGLMNGTAFYRGVRYVISALDLAMIADMGMGTTRDDIFDLQWLSVLRGGAGTDLFRGDYSAQIAAMNVVGTGAIISLPGLQLYEIERLELILGSGADTFVGGNFADKVTGGVGADRITGGGGADTFVVRTLGDISGAGDTITDFQVSLDRIDLTLLAGLTFIGQNAFSNAAGQVNFSWSGGVTIIGIDGNGDGASDGSVRLEGGNYTIGETANGSRILLASAVTVADDYLATTATTGAITVGGSVTGNIETIGDRDWFRVNLVAGHTYQLDLQGSDTAQGTLADPLLRVLNSTGGELLVIDDGGVHWNSSGTFLAAQTGVHYLSAEAYSGGATLYTGTYRLSIGDTSDATAPQLSSSTPADNATGVGVGANLQLTFNEAVRAGSGAIEIRRTSDGSLFSSIGVGDTTQASFSGSVLTLNPSADLAAGTGYYLLMGAGVVEDLAGNDFAGISSPTALNFTTAGAGGGGPAPQIGPAMLSRQEGDSGSTIFSFTVTRTGDVSQSAAYNYQVQIAAGDTASASDFFINALPSGVYTLAAGAASGTLTVIVRGDAIAEGDESFTLSISNAAGSAQARAVILDDDATSSPYTVRTVQKTGDDANRIGIVFVGDGYLASELTGAYVQHVDAMANYLFAGGLAAEPFNRYRNFFNVYAVNIASLQSGADHRGNGTFVNTALDALYYYDGVTERLLYADPVLVQNAVDWALDGRGIDNDITFLVVNSAIYGGGGGGFATYAGANNLARDVALHEVGHSFVQLADEYTAAGTGGVGGDHYSGPEPGARNITIDPTGADWAEWIGYDQPGLGPIGVYEGGYYRNTGVYRPAENSKMRTSTQPFDAVAREEFILGFYELVDPLDSHTPNDATLVDPTSIEVTPIDDSIIEVSWRLDGAPVNEGSTTSLSLAGRNLVSGAHTLTVLAEDPTDWVRGDRSLLQQEVNWTFVLSSAVIDTDGVRLNWVGGSLIDRINGSSAAENLSGGDGDDILVGRGGPDELNGQEGVDAALYANSSANYEWWSHTDGSWRVKDLRNGSPDATDRLSSIEQLQFTDKLVKLTGLTNAEKLTDAYTNVLRNVAAGSEMSFLDGLIASVNGGSKTLAAAIGEIVQKADGTTAVATLSYQFFAGFTPSKGGFDYLVSPQGPNPSNINSPYYQLFSLENRYINFAVNLGKLGEGAAGFQAEYGDLSLFAATQKAYMEIFGGTVTDAKIANILDTSVGNGLTRKDYFAVYGGDGLTGIGTKAAMVGWLLTEAAKADLGMYARSSNAFLADLADGAETFIDLIGVYGRSDYIFNG